jgi:hypothetical protein
MKTTVRLDLLAGALLGTALLGACGGDDDQAHSVAGASGAATAGRGGAGTSGAAGSTAGGGTGGIGGN